MIAPRAGWIAESGSRRLLRATLDIGVYEKTTCSAQEGALWLLIEAGARATAGWSKIKPVDPILNTEHARRAALVELDPIIQHE